MDKHSWGEATSRLFQIILIVLTASYLCQPIYDAGFFWHLTLGRWIEAHWSLPVQDIWTQATHGQTWYALSWLFSLSLSLTEKFTGASGLIFLKLLCTITTVGAVVFAFSTRAKSKFFGTFLAIIVSCGALFQSKFDPLLLGLAFFTGILHLSYKYRENPKQTSTLLKLTALFALYGNFHQSVLMAFFVGLLILNAPNRSKYIVSFLPAVFVNPYLGKQILFALKSFWNSTQLELILHSNVSTIYQYDLGILLVLVLLLAQFWHFSITKPKACEMLLAATFVLLAFWSQTYTAYALIIFGFIISTLWGQTTAEDLSKLGQGISSLQTNLTKLKPIGPVFLGLCMIIPNVSKLYRWPITELALPDQELGLILAKDLPTPILHPSSIGPYIIYRFSDPHGEPKRLAAIDPRSTEILPLQIVLNEFLFSLKPGWDQTFSRVNPQTILCLRSSPLSVFLSQSPQWRALSPNGKSSSPNWVVFTKLMNNP